MSNRILYLIIGLCTFGMSTASSQGDVMVMAELMPCISGCESKKDRDERRVCTYDKIDAFLDENLKIPKEALNAGQSGVAVIELIISKEGSVEEMSIVDDPGYGMGEAAMKAMRKMNKMWKPGSHFGEMVDVKLKVPVQFEIPEEEPEPEPVVEPDVYRVVDVMPIFDGCQGKSDAAAKNCTYEAITSYFKENLKYPAEAKDAGIEGTVNTSFVVDRSGAVTNVQLIDTLGHGCDEEAVRLITEMPTWVAGVQDGKYVNVELSLPVRFVIKDKE